MSLPVSNPYQKLQFGRNSSAKGVKRPDIVRQGGEENCLSLCMDELPVYMYNGMCSFQYAFFLWEERKTSMQPLPLRTLPLSFNPFTFTFSSSLWNLPSFFHAAGVVHVPGAFFHSFIRSVDVGSIAFKRERRRRRRACVPFTLHVPKVHHLSGHTFISIKYKMSRTLFKLFFSLQHNWQVFYAILEMFYQVETSVLS